MCGCLFQGLVWTALLEGPPFPWTALPWTALPLDRPSPGPAFRGPPEISLFFFSSPAAQIRSFLPSLGVFSWNFGGV